MKQKDLLFQYSEWLDGEGIIVSDQEEGADKRTHDDLVTEFLKKRKTKF